jgi:hypothetical protein
MNDAQFRFNQCNSFREKNISVFSHLGFRIGIKKKLLRGPSNDYSWAVWLK